MKVFAGQIVRYGIVGIVLNGVAYSVYLLLTYIGINPLVVVSVMYPLCVLASFWFNHTWSFSNEGKVQDSFTKFLIAHLLGYFLNLVLIYVFVSLFGFPHEAVQLAAIFLVAGFLFLMMKFYVFSTHRASTN